MPPRFYSSPYKNTLLTPAKREGWYSELPTPTSATSDSADLLISTPGYLLAQGAAAGTLLALPWDAPGKYGGKAPALQTGLAGRLSAVAADAWGQTVAVGGEGGQINILALPPLDALSPAQPPAPAPIVASFTLGSSVPRAIDALSSHPLASSLFLAASGSVLSILDAAPGEEAYKVEMPVQAWGAGWSAEGRCVTAGGRDGRVRMWDVRAGGGAVLDFAAHGGRAKPTRQVHLSHLPTPTLLSTGFSPMRDREFSVFDLRAPDRAQKTQRIDSGTAALSPLLDAERGLVYLSARGEHTLRWVEIPSSSPAQSTPYTSGACALPFPAQGAALAPPRAWELMRAEIGRVHVLGAGGEVVPVRAEVPRRQYLDFHRELYPPVPAGVPAQTAAEWRAAPAEDVPLLERRQLDPAVPWPARAAPALSAPSAQAHQPPQADKVSPVPVVKKAIPAPIAPAAPASAPVPATPTAPPAPPAPSASVEAAVTPSAPPAASSRPAFGARKPSPAPSPAPSPVPAAVAATAPAPSPVAATTPTQAAPTAQLSDLSLGSNPPAAASPAAPSPAAPTPTPTAPAPASKSAVPAPPATLGGSTAPDAPFNPTWSRKFLTGKTPLKPDFYDVHDLCTTMGADVALLKASPAYLLYPLSGPGGRLAFHPLSRPGRLPVHASCVAVGGAVVEFEVDPFAERRVFVAGEDGRVSVFELPAVEEWKEGETRGEAVRVLSDPKMDRIHELKPHPAAKDLLLTVSDDRGNPTARLWDVAKGEKLLEVPLPRGGVSSAAWSPSGTLLALATKNKQVHVLDLRDASRTLISAAAHDSIRPARLAWASETHLVSSGFNRAASRELILFRLSTDEGKLEQLGKTSLDVSPSPLFPFVDLDTRLVLLHSRGDRSCLAFEANLAPSTPCDAFVKLPAFEAGGIQSGWAFLPKTRVDVRKVEIVKGLRLTPSTIEVVSFTVPRAKADFFQNDIFVPTRNVEKPSMTVQEWLDGKNTPLEVVDLRPEGMELLSNAPAPVKNVSTRSKIKQDGLTDSQREAQHLDALFETAKADEDSSEDETVQPVRAAHRIEQDDDDW
ncbi:hypothetical protein JCM10450v2_004005 [Rhodotorula kratochvilovae]